MRRLLLLRHAKAERSQPGGRDEERVLTDSGRRDASSIGSYMARHAFTPGRALVSPAARTRETWELLAAGLGHLPPVEFDERLYNATPHAILETVKETAASVGALLAIGHNPGLQELAAMLVASGDIDARERLGEDFPTSALAVISFASDNWSDVHPRGGRLEHFITPGWLAAAD